MARCIHCDYSENGSQSAFFLGLHDSGHLRGRTLNWDETEQGYICSTCKFEEFDDVDDLAEEEDDDG